MKTDALTVPVRSVVPYLILRSAAVRHSTADTSVISALLSLVLRSRTSRQSLPNQLLKITKSPIDWGMILLRNYRYTSRISMLQKDQIPVSQVVLTCKLTSLRLSTACKAPDPPPIITTPRPLNGKSEEKSLGGRAEFCLRVRVGSAVTCILPSTM